MVMYVDRRYKCLGFLSLAVCVARLSCGAVVDECTKDTAVSLLPNGDFEKGAESWNLGAGWKIEEKSGRRSGACAVFDTCGETNAFRSLTSHEFPVKPCGLYRFEAYLKFDDVNLRLEVGMTYLDKSGRHLSNCVARKTKDNAVGTGGWRRYEGMSEYLPADAEKAQMFIRMWPKKDVCCRFRVDDFTVFDEAVSPVDALYSSEYRDMAATGKVRFVAPYRLDQKVHPADSLIAEFGWMDASGRSRTATVAVDGEKAEMSLDVCDLMMGAHPVTVALASKATGETFGAETNVFTHVAELPKRRVYIDSKHRYIVDGKPFFPIAMWWDEAIASPERREESMRIYKRGPFNMVNTYLRALDKDDLDFFHSHGMMTMCNLKDIFVGLTGAFPPDGIVLTEADEEPYVKKIIARCKDHPALLYYYINDEFPLTMVQRSIRRCRFIRELDDDHPTQACLDKPHHVRAFMRAFDIIGTDPYPVGKNRDLSIAAEWARQAREGTFGLRMISQTVQAFDWRWYFPEGTFPNMRFPSREEMRSMAWQQIAEGSWGIGFYSFGGFIKHFKGEEFDRRFGDVCAVASEVASFLPVFCSDEPAPAVTGVPKGLVARAWRYDGKVRYVVANTTLNRIAGSVTIGGEYVAVDLGGNGVLLK